MGIYDKAYTLLLLPIRQINTPMSHVFLPALCRLQNEPARFRGVYRRGLTAMTAVGMPVVAFVGTSADLVIRIVLGPDWGEAIPIFQALIPAAFLGTFNVASGWVFLALGRTDRQLRLGLVSSR